MKTKKLLITITILTLCLFIPALYNQNEATAQTDYTTKAKEVTNEIGPTQAKQIYDEAFHAYLSRGGHGKPNVEEAHGEAIKALATAPARYGEIGILPTN